MNPVVHPVFIVVIVNVIVVSKAMVMKNATNKPEYFLFNFKNTNQSPSCYFNIINFFYVCVRVLHVRVGRRERTNMGKNKGEKT